MYQLRQGARRAGRSLLDAARDRSRRRSARPPAPWRCARRGGPARGRAGAPHADPRRRDRGGDGDPGGEGGDARLGALAMRIVGSAEMREIDRTAIEDFGIPSLTLMDRAGRAVAEAAAALAAPNGRVLVVTGGGNNGGDGYVAARLMRGAGREARVIALVPAARLSNDARAVREQAERAGVPIDEAGELAELDAGV